MKRCPITYELLIENEGRYSLKGLRNLSSKLTSLKDFPYSAEEQREQARLLAAKLSIQGVQPKISAILDVSQQGFKVTEKGGTYIIKPQNPDWQQLPENEDLTMRMAASVGIEVPLHGLIYCADGSFSYFIKRFDRPKRGIKLAVEDFAQLSGRSRETKYNSSMEQVAKVIEKYTTFPAIEKEKLFRLTLFSFLVGNEDMHLKNFSLMSRDQKVMLSPAYDLLNSSIALKKPEEEMALPVRAKKNKLLRSDLIDYFALERLGLSAKRLETILENFSNQRNNWRDLIKISFLSGSMKEKYLEILEERLNRMGLS